LWEFETHLSIKHNKHAQYSWAERKREKKQGKTKFCLLLPMEIGGHGRKTQRKVDKATQIKYQMEIFKPLAQKPLHASLLRT